jgi:hypothetical protein
VAEPSPRPRQKVPDGRSDFVAVRLESEVSRVKVEARAVGEIEALALHAPADAHFIAPELLFGLLGLPTRYK